jgi:hypothetical protein
MPTQVADGIVFEEIEGNIGVYTITHALKPAVDEWANHAVEHFKNSSPDQPYLLLYDMSNAVQGTTTVLLSHYEIFGLGVSKQGLAEIQPLLDSREFQIIKLALVVNINVSGRVAKALGDSRRRRSSIQLFIFSNREDAIAWLKEGDR